VVLILIVILILIHSLALILQFFIQKDKSDF